MIRSAVSPYIPIVIKRQNREYGDMNVVVSRLDELLKLRGWSVYELAERAEIKRGAIYHWYRLDGCPSLESIEKICKVLGITLEQFFYASPNAELSEGERLLEDWFFMNSKEKSAVLTVMKVMKESGGER